MSSLTAPSDQELREVAQRLSGAAPEQILTWAYARFTRIAIVASFQAESVALIDMACDISDQVEVVTLDTGRLPQETYDLIDTVKERYPITIHVVCPNPSDVAEMVDRNGVNLFYRSPQLRLLCCQVRKGRPLERALAGFDAWITGLRRQQAKTRSDTPVASLDPRQMGLAKVAPLAGWTTEQVWAYLQRRQIPVHELYQHGYTSIGCAPCTRATRPGEDPRAGRWWWEQDAVKECGLHWPTPDGIPEGSDSK